MRTLLLLVLFAQAVPQTQEKTQDRLPKEPIRNWKYTRKDPRIDPKTKAEIEEVTVILAGEEAIPVNFEKKIFDLRGVEARYFTMPSKEKKSKEIIVRSDKGRYDHEARTLRLQDNVRVVKKNDDEEPPQVDTVLTAQTALLHFTKMYECSLCRAPQRAPGKCVLHGGLMRDVTITNVEVESPFEMTGPEGILSGEGLVTDDAIKKEYHIRKNGFVEFAGDSSSLPGATKPAQPAEARFAQIHSKGPLHVTGEETQRKIQGQGGMRIDRIDSTGSLAIQAQEMTIDVLRPLDPATGRPAAPEIRDVVANGKAILEGVMYADGMWFHTTSDSFTRMVNGEAETLELKSPGEPPVHVRTGASTIESRHVTITRKAGETGGVSEFLGVVGSNLVVGDQQFSLKCDVLKTIAEPNRIGKTDLREIQAEGNVVLGGLMAPEPKPGSKAEPGEAHADRFAWDVPTNRGWMEARPFVRIVQGPSLILAPKVVLESPTIIVLKGPKQVHLVQERDGAKEDYRATCDGDLVLDSGAHRLWMRDRCVIRTQEMVLRSDRVNAVLSEDGSQGLESLLALGKVHALRRSDNTNLYGDRLAFRSKDPQDLRVYGVPYAVADNGRTSARQEQIRVYEKINPKTGLPVRYTEMIGGPSGVRIEIRDAAVDAARHSDKK